MSQLKEIMEMRQILLSMGTDMYMKCKYMFLLSSIEYPRINAAFMRMFRTTDECRPPLIEMKKGGAA